MRHPRNVTEDQAEQIRQAREDFVGCGCPDIYYCPRGGEIECSRHSGFTVCCDRPGDHIPVRDSI